MKTIRQSKIVRAWNGRCRVGDIVIFDVLGAAPRGSGATEAAARDAVRRVAEAHGGTIGRPMREKVFLAAACFILLILAAAFIVHFVVP